MWDTRQEPGGEVIRPVGSTRLIGTAAADGGRVVITTHPGEDPGDDDFQGGHFQVDLGGKRLPLATAAPGVE